MARTIGEAFIDVKPDTSRTGQETRTQAKKMGKEFGATLNDQLKRMNLAPIDVKADPKSALKAIEETEAKLKAALSADATTVEIKVRHERALSDLARFKKQLGDVGDDAGGFFAVRFLQRVGPAIASGPGIAVAGTAIGVALAPSIAAGIGAGIAGGVGGAGIIGGIALVAKDPEVAAAGKDVGTRFAAGVTAEAQSFKAPVLGALNQIDQAASRTVPKIGQIFRNTAPSVDRLTGSLIRAGDAITDGLVAASSRSAGPLGAMGDLVENVGTEFGHTIDVLSQRSPEGVSAINDLSNAATNMIRTVTGLVDGVARIKGGLDSFDKGIDSGRAHFEDFVQKMTKGQSAFDITADGYRVGSEAADLYRKGVIGINGSLNDYAHYQQQGATATHQFIMDTYKADPPVKALVISLNNAEKAALGERSALTALSNQLRAQASPAFALIDAQNTLKTAQNNAAEATKNHGRNSVEARTATRALALAAIDLEGKAGALGNTFNGKLSPSMRVTLEAAGLTKKQIADVGKEFRDAKRDGDKFSKKYQANATLTGGPAVSTKLKILGEMQAALRTGTKPAAYYGNLNRQLLQARMAAGGEVPGFSPHKRADNVLIAATAKEWVHPVDSVDYYGPVVMEAIQKKKIRRDDLVALAGYADGGRVWPYRVTASQTRVPSWKEVAAKAIWNGTYAGGSVGSAQRFIAAQSGKPYIWASAGPRGYDCSGIVSAAYNVLKGRNPYMHTFSTGSLPDGFFREGQRSGALVAGWSHPGQSPASSTTGHMAGQLGNMPFESRGSRGVIVGGGARRVGQFAHIGAAMDNGGYLMPGWNPPIYNGTGRPEPVIPADQLGGDIHIHLHNSVIASKAAAVDMLAEAYKTAVRDKKIKVAKVG